MAGYAPALAGLGRFAAQGAGLLVLAAVVGRGVAPPLLGWLAGLGGWWVAFGMLASGSLYLLYYALRGSRTSLPPGQPT